MLRGQTSAEGSKEMRTEPQEAEKKPGRRAREGVTCADGTRQTGLQGHSPEVVGDLEPGMEKSEQCQGGGERWRHKGTQSSDAFLLQKEEKWNASWRGNWDRMAVFC